MTPRSPLIHIVETENAVPPRTLLERGISLRRDSTLLCALATVCGLAAPLRSDDLVISELLASNRLTAIDEDGDSSDWIEIYNPGPAPRSLAGYALTSGGATPRRHLLPPIVVPAGGVSLVWMSGKDRHVLPPETVRESTHIPFERMFIKPGNTWSYLLESPGVTAPPDGWTTLGFDDGEWPIGPSGFGYDDGDDATEVPEGTIAVLVRRAFTVEAPADVKQLVLEVDYDDGFVAYLNGARVASVNSPDEHPGFRSVATSKSDENAGAERFDLTAHVDRLVPGKNVLAIVGLNDSPSSDMSLIPSLGTLPLVPHASFRLPLAGGSIALRDPDGKVVDRIDYPPLAPDQSFGRSFSDGDEIGVLLTPTPDGRNGKVSLPAAVTANISFAPAAGTYDGPTKVRIDVRSPTRGLVPRYATNGSALNASSPRIDGPIVVTKSTVIRVAGFYGEERATPVHSASYFVGPPLPRPVISIALEPVDFQKIHLERDAHGRGTEKPAHMEILDTSGKVVLSTGFGFRLHGGYGRRGGLETKKSYRAYFRAEYGEGKVTHPIIPSAEVRDYDKIVLRAGFNDRLRLGGGGSYARRATQIRDQVIRDLHEEMGGVVAHGAWYAVYINMKYWGIYNVTERLDDQFLDSHFGEAEWDVIKTGGNVVSGSKDGWQELGRLAKTSDLSIEANYQEIARRVDIEDFTAYVILNLWAQNHDWPHNNWYAFRKIGGKWRFLSWDAEFGMGLIPSTFNADSYEHIVSKRRKTVRDLFVALVRNAKYAEYFQSEVERYLDGPLSPANVIEKITRHQREIAPLMALECSVVAPGNSPFNWIQGVQWLVQFAQRRPEYVRLHTRRFFAGLLEDKPPGSGN